MTKRAVPGDHFSGVSSGYATFRPRYPRALFERIVPLAPKRALAWDCAAGTGQATLDLADFFDRVIATDASAAQIAAAPAHPKITWAVAPAEHSGIESGTVDLVAVAQALHWFDQPAFYAEAQRVGVDGAAIAVWSYGSAEMPGALGKALSTFEQETVGPYWPAERRFVNEVYSTIQFPFDQLVAPTMHMEERWTRAQLLGYMRTWSATSRYAAANGTDPVEQFDRQLDSLWKDREARKTIRWPLTIRAGKMSKH